MATFQLRVWGSLSTLKLRTVLDLFQAGPAQGSCLCHLKKPRVLLGLSVDSSLFYSQALCLL